MTYDWQQDARDCYTLALYYMALSVGSRRAKTPNEFYFVEGLGLIP